MYNAVSMWKIKTIFNQHSPLGGRTIMARNQRRNTNELVAPQARTAIDQMKYEIASEFGVQLGPDTTSRQNGSVGGEITKRLVQMAEQQLGGRMH
ncbi:Small, acid-soluble spore protein A [compost metagenome]|nr:Putative small, acid-soluble spore protein [Aneurinibacillus migulanus]